ncbi:hypothetical protein [Nocardioides coralli]|uniref:hypothetical protein n=1 Tax=Nocardioides coralli TaxID=2872154 RepID=UPI001CA39E37|nr:hypothetical protein [Nocardioides coralli]QZY29607.1 hypothetical protein K6T13_02630 [Nocardioides coralli]
MDTELTTLIVRPRGWQRLQRWPGMVILGIGIWSLFFADPWAVAFIALGLWGTSEMWRGIRVTGDTLHMQGRIVRRTLPLAQVRQVGIAPSRSLWVQPEEGPTLLLHMAETRTDRPGSLADAVDRLRELAAGAGADLEPALEEPTSPPRPTTRFFGW